jgi:hypothetical protein
VGVNDLESAIRKLATEDLDTRAGDELAGDLVDLETASGLLEAERSRRLGAFNQRQAYVAADYTSSTAFLIHRCRIAPGRAKRLVAHSNSLAEMPTALDALSDGLISADQVRQLILAHDTNPEIYVDHEAGLVEAIAPLTVGGTARAVDYWRQTVNEERFEADVAGLHDQRRLHLSQTFEGMGRIDGWLDPEGFAYVKAALDAATPPPAKGDDRTPARRRADALVDLARLALDRGDLPESGGEKPHLTVLVNLDVLTGQGHGICETEDGIVLPRSTIERISCDASVSRIVIGPNSEPLDVGRKTRVIPPALRRAVIARDRHCQHRGCERPAKWCDVHHKKPWSQGGETKLANLELQCRYHHPDHHPPHHTGSTGH